MKRAVLWGLGLALGAFALLCVLNPLMGLVLLAEITGSGFGHPRNPPALAEGVDVRGTWTAKKGVPAERRWDTIVRRHFLTVLGGTALPTDDHPRNVEIEGIGVLSNPVTRS